MGRALKPAGSDMAWVFNCPPEVVSLILGQLSENDIKSLRRVNRSCRDAIDEKYFRPFQGRTAPLVIRVGEDDELRAAAALRWGLDPELLRGELLWECGVAQLQSRLGTMPFEHLRVVSHASDRTGPNRPPNADRQLGQIVAGLKGIKTLHLSANKRRVRPFLEGMADLRQSLVGLELDFRNGIGETPLENDIFDAVVACSQLRSLTLAGHARHTLPSSLSTLSQLTRLEFRAFYTHGLVDPAGAPPALEVLTVDEYHPTIGHVDFGLALLKNLKALRIAAIKGSRAEEYLKDVFYPPPTLESLELRRAMRTPDGGFSSLVPGHLATLTRLKRLVLTSTRLVHLPPGLQSLTNLESVEVSAPLQTFPVVSQWVNVTKLTLKNTKLKHFPASIAKLSKLTSLVLENNRSMHGLPADIGQLQQLRELRIASSPYIHLREGVASLSRLETCTLVCRSSSHPLTTELLQAPSLRTLTVSTTDIHLPQLPSLQTTLTHMDVSADIFLGNEVFFSSLQGLRSLTLRGFSASPFRYIYLTRTSTGDAISHATRLTKLVLEGQFKSNPNDRLDYQRQNPFDPHVFQALPKLVNLREFHADLTGASDETLNTALASLTNLRVLRLGAKYVTALPSVVFTLTNLEELVARRGCISHIPAKITSLQRLRELDLCGTRSVALPDALLGLPKLARLNMQVDFADADSARVYRQLVRNGVAVGKHKPPS